MEREKTIEGKITTLIASSNNTTFSDTLFTESIDVPFKPDTKHSQLIYDEATGGLPILKGYSLTFNDCTFDENVNMSSDNNKTCILTFVNCIFEKDVLAEDAVMDGKVRFRNCTFKGKVNFRNTTFNNLLDLWRSTFEQTTVFYKTDFMDIVVLSAATFDKNVLFTYSLIDKLLILRGTKAKEGFDLSLAIISGKLSVFDFKLKYFESYNIHNLAIKKFKKDRTKSYFKYFETVYENAVSGKAEIPINNKRETFRILKKYHESQSNIVESIPFSVLEKRTLFQESGLNLISIGNKKNKITAFSNLWVLSWNAISNWFNASYILGAFFTIFVAIIFFNLSLLFTEKEAFAFNFANVSSGMKDFLNFFNPVHKFDYLGEDILISKTTIFWFYVFDFIGRLFIGYGIYQTVQAFRKFR
ncbi:MAG: hypothetical protein ACI849_001295 [Patiriisocius sp.]|jgi:hypothetical protein